MVKNIIKYATYAVLIIFCCATHQNQAMLGRTGQVLRRIPSQFPKPHPGKVATPQPVQIPSHQEKFPELNQPPRQPGRSVRIPQGPQSLFENIAVPINQTTLKPETFALPGVGTPHAPGAKASRFETLKKIQISEKPLAVNPEIIKNIDSLEKEGYPGSGIAKNLILGESIESVQKTFEQEKNIAQQSGYRFGFIRPNAPETRAALEQLFEKSLDDASHLMKNWESIVINNVPYIEFIQLPDKSIIFLERTSQTFPLLIGNPNPKSLISRLETVIEKELSDEQGAALLFKAKESAIKKAEADRLAEIEKEKVLEQEVDIDLQAFEKELTEEQALESEIAGLKEDLDLATTEIAHIEQSKQAAQQRFEQERKQIAIDADVELKEFQAQQLKEKDQLLAKAQDEAKRSQPFRNLDIEQQEKFLNRLKNNYEEKIAQDLANKKQSIQANKNERIQMAENEIKQLEGQQKQLEQKQKDLRNKIQQQETLSLEIAKDTKKLMDMELTQKENEEAGIQIQQKREAAQKQFDLEKKQIEDEFNKKLQNAENARVQQTEKNKAELKKPNNFINADIAQQELLLERLEKNALQESEEIKKSLEKQKGQRLKEIERAETQATQEFEAQQEELEQKQNQLKLEKQEHRKNLEQRLAQEKLSIKQQEQELEETIQHKKNEIAQQKEATKQKAAEEGKTVQFIAQSAQEETEKLEQELQNLQEQHSKSKELLKEQKSRIEQAQAEVKRLTQEELEAQQARVKETQENAQENLKAAQQKTVDAAKKVADKNAELELINKDAAEKENEAKKAGQEVARTQLEKQELEKLAQELQKELEAEKKQLSEKEQEELLLKEEQDKKEHKAQQARIEQEIAEEKEAQLKAEQVAQAAQEAAEKAAEEKAELERAEQQAKQELEDAIKKEREQEQLRKEAEKRERDKEEEEEKRKKAEEKKEIELPGGGDDQLPAQVDEAEKKPEILPETDLLAESKPLPKQKIEPLKPLFEMPRVLSEEIKPIGQVSKIGMEKPSPLQAPAVSLEETEPIQKPFKEIDEKETIQPPSPQTIKPSESPIAHAQPQGQAADVDMSPIRLTPSKASPFPKPEILTYQPHIPRSGSASSTRPIHAPSSGISSSGSSDWPTEQQPVLPEIKTQQPQQQTKQKTKKLPPEALVLLETLFSTKSDMVKRDTTKNKGNGAWLREFLLQKKHAMRAKKSKTPIEKPETVDEKEKQRQPLSFVQKVTTTIKNAVTAVIDTIVTGIQQLFFNT